jgi:homoaconitate hydratase
MGDREGLVYLASPAVVAASALAGYVCAPTQFTQANAKTSIKVTPPRPTSSGQVEIIQGFPSTVRGRALLVNRDNLNTDGIYAGKWTYKDDMTPTEMAGVIFENYDPAFRSLARAGDIVVSGRNFGTGSSREQAATALKVVAISFSETYKRNAFNNGFVVFECPELVAFLREQHSEDRRPTVAGPELEIDYQGSTIRCGQRAFPFPPLSPVAQELEVAGGAEAVESRRLAKGSAPHDD